MRFSLFSLVLLQIFAKFAFLDLAEGLFAYSVAARIFWNFNISIVSQRKLMPPVKTKKKSAGNVYDQRCGWRTNILTESRQTKTQVFLGQVADF